MEKRSHSQRQEAARKKKKQEEENERKQRRDLKGYKEELCIRVRGKRRKIRWITAKN